MRAKKIIKNKYSSKKYKKKCLCLCRGYDEDMGFIYYDCENGKEIFIDKDGLPTVIGYCGKFKYDFIPR